MLSRPFTADVEAGHADFAGLVHLVLAVVVQVGVVLLAVAVRVDEDRAGDVREPTGETEGADVGVLAGDDVDLGGGDDEVLLLIPHRHHVLARGHVVDLEMTGAFTVRRRGRSAGRRRLHRWGGSGSPAIHVSATTPSLMGPAVLVPAEPTRRRSWPGR